MLAMLLERQRSELKKVEIPRPAPASGQVLIRVGACAVCRTDLHIVDGELARPKLPLILGHEIVGVVDQAADGAPFRTGDRVGVPWLGWTCGVCVYCKSGRENLCDRARFTGYDIDGGYAEYCIADARYCFRSPDNTMMPTPRRSSVRGSLGIERCDSLAIQRSRSDWASMASARRRISSRRSRYPVGSACSLSLAAATASRKHSPERWEPSGLARATSDPSHSMRQSSSRPPASSFQRHSARRRREERSFAPAFT